MFPWLVDFEVAREKDVGVRTFRSVGRFVEEYKRGKLDPGDVKHAMAINKMLKPVRGHFGSDTSLCARLVESVCVDSEPSVVSVLVIYMIEIPCPNERIWDLCETVIYM